MSQESAQQHSTEDHPASQQGASPDGQVELGVRTSAILDVLPDLIFVLDAEGCFQACHTRSPDSLLLPAHEFLGKQVFDVLPPDLAQTTMENLRRTLETGQVQRYEYTLEVGGQLGHYESRMVLSTQGEVLALVRNLTRLKAVEQALEASQERYRALVETMNEGFGIQDADGVITYVNARFCEMVGYGEDELIGLPAVELMDEKNRRIMLQQTAKRKKVRGESYPITWTHKSGKPVHTLVSPWALRDDQGEYSGSFAVITDVTALRRTEAERDRLIAELEAKNQELERYASIISHDLKAPLTTIDGFLGYLRNDLDAGRPEQALESLERVQSAAEKMRERIEGLLRVTRLGYRFSPVADVDLQRMVREILESLEGSLKDHPLEIRTAPDLPTARVEPYRLYELLHNLIENATRFLHPDRPGRVEIGWRPDPRGLLLFVRDNGIGILPQDQRRIFDLFEKLDPDSSGTGVGLALCRRIAELHDGQLWVESEPDRGSTFYVLLPS